MINTPEQSDQDRLILLISEKERLCLDAYLFNSSNKIQAYKVAKDITKEIDYVLLQARANHWIASKTSQAYLVKHKSIVLSENDYVNKNSDENGNDIFDKDSIILGIQNLISKTNDTKLKADLYLKLADLKGYKKLDTNVPTDQYRLYLPIRCESCEYKPK